MAAQREVGRDPKLRVKTSEGCQVTAVSSPGDTLRKLGFMVFYGPSSQQNFWTAPSPVPRQRVMNVKNITSLQVPLRLFAFREELYLGSDSVLQKNSLKASRAHVSEQRKLIQLLDLGTCVYEPWWVHACACVCMCMCVRAHVVPLPVHALSFLPAVPFATASIPSPNASSSGQPFLVLENLWSSET